MANIGRKFLIDHGVPDEQLDAIMNEINTTITNRLTGYIPQAEVQSQIDAALKAVKQPEPVDPKTTKEYLELQEERDMLRTVGGDDFSRVKPKFREQVFKMLERGPKAKPIADQLTGIQEKYDEYFIGQQQEPQPKPQFGAPVQGSMPTGDEGTADRFQKAWGFVPKKG